MVYTQTISVMPEDCNASGEIKLSALLWAAQEVSGAHCTVLGYGWDVMDEKGLFWAVLRHRILIHRLPRAGQEVTLQTWPMPTTRVAYPRLVRGLDSEGNVLFEVVSLWVLMDILTRAMVLPGKSGVTVSGVLLGDEPAPPGTLVPGTHESTLLWQVSPEDLDRNGHVNNARYLDHTQALAEQMSPKEVTVCYLCEVLPGQEISIEWTLSPEGILAVDGYRRRTDVHGKTERVFAVRCTG